jgi:hypothetical protein
MNGDRAVTEPDPAALVAQLSTIREELIDLADEWRPWTDERDGDRDASARNLLQYLALRGHELRDLQDPLVALGLSSLGGSERHVQASVDAVLTALSALDHQPCSPAPPAPIGFARSRAILAARTEALLGPAPVGRPTRMMVTMPSEAATDPDLVSVMLARGMDCMRINCAHDTAAQWRAMRENLLGAHSHEALRFAIEAADIIGLSFVSHARDVKRVDEYLDLHGRPDLGMVLKIETRRAFDHLPGLLLAALGARRPAGVMIARGDLAVECGYERLAEVQEEILWLCQAAHVPVIWATEVLDRLARTGRPSRAEITDAAMGERAECVMLNKGPRIVEAITVLDDILRRMERHQRKKRSLLARLGASDYVHSER